MSANVCSRCRRPTKELNPAKLCSACVTDELLGKMNNPNDFFRRTAHSMGEDLRKMQEEFLRAQMFNDWSQRRPYGSGFEEPGFEFTIDPCSVSVNQKTKPVESQTTVSLQDLDAMRARAMRAELEARCLQRRIQELETQIALLRSRQAQPQGNGAIPQDMIKKILSLVHPDKHSGSDAATQVTRYILSLRAKP